MPSEDNDNLLEPETPESADWQTKAKQTMTQWNERYCLWKNFNESQLDLVKSYVGLTLFGRPETKETSNSELNIATLYELYDSEKKSKIDEIVGLFEFENGQLNLSHTLLYLSINDWQICVFRQMKFSGEVNFIDFNGRVYTSWQHFVETNKLPKCEYMAPVNGIHDIMTDEVEIHESRASSILGTLCEYAAFGATATAVALVGFSAAPVTATVLGATGATYGVGQSFYGLLDRAWHRQSIAPTNLESVVCYMNIGTSFVCGASAVSAMKSAKIIQLSGKYGNVVASVIRGVNYTATASVFTNFGLHLFILQQKVRHGEASVSDLFGLCIDIFLMYGAVSEVREMRSCLSNLEVSPATPPKGLSKGARRRWRKSQAKLSSVSANQNVTTVCAWDNEIFYVGIGIAGIAFKKLLHHYCPVINEIYQSVCLIIEDFINFFSEKTPPEVFCENLVTHCHNLYTFLQNNAREIRDKVVEFFQRLDIYASPRSIGEISNIIDDGVVAINNLNEYEEISPEDGSAPELKPSTDAIVYKMILNIVQKRIRLKEINTLEELLSIFAQELASVVDEIEMKITHDYEEMLSYNNQLLGEEKAKVILSGIGINSKNDYANTIIERVIESLKCNDQLDDLTCVEKQLYDLFSIYHKLFLSMTDENDISPIGALETCEILNKSIEVIIQPITTLYTKSKEIYEINVKFFGAEKAMIFVSEAMSLNNSSISCEDYNDSTFLGLAIKSLNLDENKSRLLPLEENTQEPIAEFVRFTDDFKMETLLNICDFYVQRIGYDEKNLAKIYSFVTDKFTDHFVSLANQENATVDMEENLKWNNNFFSENNFKQLNRFLRETNILEIFNRVVEIFKKKDFAIELIAEYYKTMHNVTDFHAEYLKHLVADDGVTIYTIVIGNREDIEEFKKQAEILFGLDKHNLNVVTKAESLIVLKNADDKYVVFQILKNKTEALVMQVDLSKKVEEKE